MQGGQLAREALRPGALPHSRRRRNRRPAKKTEPPADFPWAAAVHCREVAKPRSAPNRRHPLVLPLLLDRPDA
jgi:hypothetical protein